MDNIAALRISALTGVGAKTAESLQQLKIETVQDILFHLPLRYEDRTRVTPIAKLQIGSKAVIEATLITGQVQFGKRRSLLCRVRDASGELLLRFFYFNAQQSEQLTTAGVTLRCFGEVRRSYGNRFEMVHPEYRQSSSDSSASLQDTLTPVYASVKGLQQATWRKLINQALQLSAQANGLTELLPDKQTLSLHDALLYLHHPPANADIDALLQGKHPAQQRLAFEELVAHQVGLARFRAAFRQRRAPKLAVIASKQALQQQLLDQLPFQLTSAQQRVIAEINHDLEQGSPMLRLVQGDVGSGKTIVAALALLQAVQHGKQAALMAPTELLAEQHLHSLQAWFTPLTVRIAWLSGSLTAKNRQSELAKIQGHEVDVIVGTHALFQEQVNFADLALLVVDEQHRFGVDQRLALKKKGCQGEQQPHQLMMTATPIPRTLTMTAYADLDVSIIDELPPGRQTIQTLLASNQRRNEIMARVNSNCKQGKQAYWVCTLIDDSELLRAEAAEACCLNLSQALPQLSIALVHGRLTAQQKEQIMTQFKAGNIDLLVATTVIEVGVDVPNASLMIIENAERLGLAQLHQLRGRVGRGQQQSFCVLLYQAPLSLTAKTRLQVMRDHHDGFYIAEQDLAIRGPGEVLGTRQTGLLRFKIADLLRDESLLPQAKALSQQIVAEQPERVTPLLDRWLKGQQQYAEV